MSERELLPCPFCGGKDVTLRCQMRPEPNESRPWYWAVWCECGARCKADSDVYGDDAEARAIAAWNTRSPSRPLILEEAAKVCEAAALDYETRADESAASRHYATAHYQDRAAFIMHEAAQRIRSLSHDGKAPDKEGEAGDA